MLGASSVGPGISQTSCGTGLGLLLPRRGLTARAWLGCNGERSVHLHGLGGIGRWCSFWCSSGCICRGEGSLKVFCTCHGLRTTVSRALGVPSRDSSTPPGAGKAGGRQRHRAGRFGVGGGGDRTVLTPHGQAERCIQHALVFSVASTALCQADGGVHGVMGWCWDRVPLRLV